MQRNETDRLEKNGIDGDAAILLIVSIECGIKRRRRRRGEGKRKERRDEKRTSVQYSITQIDTDKAIVEALLFLLLCLLSYTQ